MTRILVLLGLSFLISPVLAQEAPLGYGLQVEKLEKTLRITGLSEVEVEHSRSLGGTYARSC